MANQLVPLTNNPNQSITFSPVVDSATLRLMIDLAYNEDAGYWVMGITDPTSGDLLVDSIPLICGGYPAANLLKQYQYLGIGSAYIINASGVAQDSPDNTNLGTDFVMVWGDTTIR